MYPFRPELIYQQQFQNAGLKITLKVYYIIIPGYFFYRVSMGCGITVIVIYFFSYFQQRNLDVLAELLFLEIKCLPQKIYLYANDAYKGNSTCRYNQFDPGNLHATMIQEIDFC